MRDVQLMDCSVSIESQDWMGPQHSYCLSPAQMQDVFFTLSQINNCPWKLSKKNVPQLPPSSLFYCATVLTLRKFFVCLFLRFSLHLFCSSLNPLLCILPYVAKENTSYVSSSAVWKFLSGVPLIILPN